MLNEKQMLKNINDLRDLVNYKHEKYLQNQTSENHDDYIDTLYKLFSLKDEYYKYYSENL